MPKTSAISVRVTASVKAAAEKAASEDSRSVASLVEKVLAGWLRERGYLLRETTVELTASAPPSDAFLRAQEMSDTKAKAPKPRGRR